MSRFLIVEDDESIGSTLRDGIECEGHTALLERDGDAALRAIHEMRPDLVILDWILPTVSGLDVCRRLRAERNHVPIIMVTGRAQEIEKVVALKSGADDYVTKPFSFTELMARVEAVLRRSSRGADRPRRHEFDGVCVDFDAHEATKNGRALSLSTRELKLLEYLIRHEGQVIGRDELLEAVWGYETLPLTRTVDMHVAKLRRKIEAKPDDPRHILTVHRAGYKFVS